MVTKTADAKIKFGVSKNDDKEILLVTADVNLVAKEFQKHKHCHKNNTWVLSKPDYFMSNTSMEDFTTGLNSAIDIIEQGVVLECRLCTSSLLAKSIWL